MTMVDDEYLSDESLAAPEPLIEEIEAAWEELRAAVRGLPDEAIARPRTLVSWSVKDLLAHVAAWEVDGVRRLEAIVHGRGAELTWHESRSDEDAFNARAVEANLGDTVDEVVKRLDEAHRDFVDLLAAFGDEVLAAPLAVPAAEWIPGWTYLHYQEHTPQITALRATLV